MSGSATASQPAPTRLSLSTDVDESGVWSPDGLRIAWAGQRRKVMVRGAGAVLPEQTIATFDPPVQVWDWSRDGRSLLIGRRSTTPATTSGSCRRSKARARAAVRDGGFNQTYGAFSPDGRSIAYASDESGQFDIYVDAFPKPGTRVRVTTAGGTEPRWSGDGRELFFRRGSGFMHVVSSMDRDIASVSQLFDLGADDPLVRCLADGRFLVNVAAAQQSRCTCLRSSTAGCHGAAHTIDFLCVSVSPWPVVT